MEEYQIRVVEELAQLKEKYDKLKIYLNNATLIRNLSEIEYRLLHLQLNAMKGYIEILDLRITLFK